MTNTATCNNSRKKIIQFIQNVKQDPLVILHRGLEAWSESKLFPYKLQLCEKSQFNSCYVIRQLSSTTKCASHIAWYSMFSLLRDHSLGTQT